MFLIRRLKNSPKLVEGVADVHDLHVWTVCTAIDALSVHVVLDGCQPS